MSKFLDKFAKGTISMCSLSLTPEELASCRLERLEEIARREVGDLNIARALVARRLGVSPGQLERARRKRLKGIRAALADRIRDAFLAALKNEKRGIEDEISKALAGGAELDSHEMGAFQAAMAARARSQTRRLDGGAEGLD